MAPTAVTTLTMQEGIGPIVGTELSMKKSWRFVKFNISPTGMTSTNGNVLNMQK